MVNFSQYSQALIAAGSSPFIFGATGETFRLSQREMASASGQAIADGLRLFHVVGPGGVGKTRFGIFCGEQMRKAGGKTLFVTYNTNSVMTFAKEARKLLPDVKIGAYCTLEKTSGDIEFITYGSFIRGIRDGRIVPSEYSQLIMDEMHMYFTPLAEEMLSRFENAAKIGMSATPRYYAGKEATDYYGPCVHEISIETARERGEICPYVNFLLKTGLETGISNLKPEDEESLEVIEALNTPERNKLIANLVLEGVVRKNMPDGTVKEIRLLGEPIIIMGKSVNYANDIANQINALLPKIREDEALVKILADKGIDIFKIEKIVEPIHAGGSEEYNGIDADKREKLIGDYHARRVLMLSSTSLLQQSFDSKITTVVIDTIPRQTYTGVGQSGMRALRANAGKDLAIIINMMDNYGALTFTDFTRNRGHEEGVELYISYPNEEVGNSKARIYNSEGIRKLNRLPAYEKVNERYFSAEDYVKLRGLLVRINSGDEKAESEFSSMVIPAFVEKLVNKAIKAREQYDDWDQAIGSKLDYESAYTIALNSYMKALTTARNRMISWWEFGVLFNDNFNRGLKVWEKKLDSKESFERNARFVLPDIAGSYVLFEAKDKLTMFEEALSRMDKVDAQVIRLRLEGHSFAHIGEVIGLTGQRASVIVDEAAAELSNYLLRHMEGDFLTDTAKSKYKERVIKAIEDGLAVRSDYSLLPPRPRTEIYEASSYSCFNGVYKAAKSGLVGVAPGYSKREMEKVYKDRLRFDFPGKIVNIYIVRHEKGDVCFYSSENEALFARHQKDGEKMVVVDSPKSAMLMQKAYGNDWVAKVLSGELRNGSFRVDCKYRI